jgi:hypothetical protein
MFNLFKNQNIQPIAQKVAVPHISNKPKLDKEAIDKKFQLRIQKEIQYEIKPKFKFSKDQSLNQTKLKKAFSLVQKEIRPVYNKK